MSRRCLVAAVALVFAAAVAAGCIGGDHGDGDSMTLEEYFDELASIRRAAEERSARAIPPDLGPDASFEKSRDAGVQFYEQTAAAATDTVDEVADLNPPDHVRDEHDAFVRALQELPGFFDEYSDRIANAPSEEEVIELTLGDFGEAIFERADDACADLQAVADESNIDIDLDCDGRYD